MAQLKETNHDMLFEDFVKLMEEHGFKVGYEEDYTSEYSGKQKEVILYDKKHGFIIHANSYHDKLNRAKLYREVEPNYSYKPGDEKKYPLVEDLYNDYMYPKYNIRYNEPIEEFINRNVVRITLVPEHSSNSSIGKTSHFYFDVNIQNGGIAVLNKLTAENPFAKPSSQWQKKNKLLFFANYGLEEKETYGEDKKFKPYKESIVSKITNDKLLKCPPEVLKIINDPERFEESENEM